MAEAPRPLTADQEGPAVTEHFRENLALQLLNAAYWAFRAIAFLIYWALDR